MTRGRRPDSQTERSLTPVSVDGKPDKFVRAFSQFPEGTYVCAVVDPAGRTVSGLLEGVVPISFGSPRVLFVLRNNSSLAQLLSEGGRCAISLLAQGQDDLLQRDSGEPEGHRQGNWRRSASGLPIVEGAACWVECEVSHLYIDDEVLTASARATDVGLAASVHPMLSYQGGYGAFVPGSLSAAPMSGLEPAGRIAELARGPIETLASELGVECSVVAYEDWHTVSIAIANHAPAARPTRLGYRIPVIPPLGIQFVDAPGTGLDEAAWVARLGSASHAEAALVRAQLARVRERGWSLMLDGPVSIDDIDRLVREYTKPEHTAEDEAALLSAIRVLAPYHEPEEVLDTEFYDVLAMSVPVLDQSEETVVLLRMRELPRQASGFEVRSWIALLQEAAQSVEALLADHSSRLRITQSI